MSIKHIPYRKIRHKSPTNLLQIIQNEIAIYNVNVYALQKKKVYKISVYMVMSLTLFGRT